MCTAKDTVAGRSVKCPKCGDQFVTAATLDGRSVDTAKGRLSPTKDPFPSLPAEFGRYRVLELLGRGGMGAVYLAQDSQLGRKVALKIPFLDGVDAKRVERFTREARSAAALHHPNICTVFDAGTIDGRPFITMAYVAGTPLDQAIDPDAPVPPRRAAEIARGIALALAYAHENGVVHRDLKPANVMLTASGEPVVMDFGLAKLSGDADPNEMKLSRQGGLVGTPSYMAPEQVRGDVAVVGAATDVYALGVVLFEMLAGQTPYVGPLVAILGQILTAPVPVLRNFRADAPSWLGVACAQAMAKDPAERFGSMKEFAHVLDVYLQNPDAVTVPAPEPVEVELVAAPPPAPEVRVEPPMWEAVAGPSDRPAGRRGRPGWVRAAVAAGVAAAVLFGASAGGVFRAKAKDGVIALEDLPADTEVQIDGEAVPVVRNGDRVTVPVSRGGPHKLKLVQNGTTIHASDVTVALGGDPVRVRVDGRGLKAVAKGGEPKPADPPLPPRNKLAEMVLAEKSEWAGTGIVKKGASQWTKAGALTITDRRGSKFTGLFRVENLKRVFEGTVTESGDMKFEASQPAEAANPAPLPGSGEVSKNRMAFQLTDSNNDASASYEFKRLPDGGDSFSFEGNWMCFDQPTGWRGLRPVLADGTLFQGRDKHNWGRDGGLIWISFGQWLAIDPDNPNVLNGGGGHLTVRWNRQ